MEMGQRIKQLRKEMGWTQAELASKLGLKDSAIAKYEKGRVENMKRDTIAKMAELFGCSPVYLMCMEDRVNKDSALSHEEQNVIRSYRTAPEGIKDSVCKLLDVKRDEKRDVSETSSDMLA